MSRHICLLILFLVLIAMEYVYLYRQGFFWLVVCRRRWSSSDRPLSQAVSETNFESTQKVQNTTKKMVATMGMTSLCSMLSKGPSPLALWAKHIGLIFNASRLPLDHQYHLHDDTLKVLKTITPRLPLSHRTFPRNWKTMGVLFKKVADRLEYLQQGPGTLPGDVVPPSPPIRIVVLGGSVTMGNNCWVAVENYANRNCAWPTRLENLINQIAGGKLVTVENAAVGGTNTEIGRSILEYDLLGVATPDIIINAYSTNDMHILSMKEAVKKNMTLRDSIFDMAQRFCRVVLSKCMTPRDESKSSRSNEDEYRPPPLLIWLDDYIGNEQREILKTTELSQGIQVLANYYGFGFVSYADAVRDLVYGDTRESMFSPVGWYNEKKKPGKFLREIHPGSSMHIATSYMIAYYMLNTASHYCSLADWDIVQYEKTMLYNSTNIPNLPKLRTREGDINYFQEPHPRPHSLPPRLHANLSLETVSIEWQNATTPRYDAAGESKRCPFSWVSGLWRVQELDPKQSILELFEPYWVQPSGWALVNDKAPGKDPVYGLCPNTTAGNNQGMTLDFGPEKGHNILVRQVTIFYLKSYGPKWENSTALLRIQKMAEKPINLGVHILSGHHDKNTSEIYQEEIVLEVPQSQVRIQLEHASGKAFKVSGIAICS